MFGFVTQFADHCGSFFGIPTWYEYVSSGGGSSCDNPNIDSLNDIWLIGLAVLDMLLSIAVLAAIIYFLWGTLELIWSRGNPEDIAGARSRMINALIGLVIAFLSATIVSYVAARLGA